MSPTFGCTLPRPLTPCTTRKQNYIYFSSVHLLRSASAGTGQTEKADTDRIAVPCTRLARFSREMPHTCIRTPAEYPSYTPSHSDCARIQKFVHTLFARQEQYASHPLAPLSMAWTLTCSIRVSKGPACQSEVAADQEETAGHPQCRQWRK